jgi:hypothetical protein
MQFETKILCAAVESAITQAEIAHNREQNTRRAAYELKSTEHAEKYNPLWEKAIPRLRAAIRAGRPITADMVPRSRTAWNKEVEIFTEHPPKDASFVVPHDLYVMRNALRLVMDETVSTTSLRQLGVSATMVRTVCELAREDVAKQEAEKGKPVKDSSAKPKTSRRVGAKTVSVLPQDRS